jgi:hypothetical protein
MLKIKYLFLLKRMVKERLAQGKKPREDLFSYLLDTKDPETGAEMRMGELVPEATFFLRASVASYTHVFADADLDRWRYHSYNHRVSLLLPLTQSRCIRETCLEDPLHVPIGR